MTEDLRRAWRTRRWPERLVIFFVFVELALVAQEIYHLAPGTSGNRIIVGTTIGAVRLVLLSVILWLGSQAPIPDDTPRIPAMD
ncbi:MAG: hypothetical protein ACLFTK_08360 [Anaerolineales bacterium]